MIINLKPKIIDSEWHRCFVILPKRTLCNKLVFMQYCNRRWNAYSGMSVGDFSGYSFYLGCWEYKL